MTDKICSNGTEVRVLCALLRVCHTTMMSIALLVRLSRTLNRFTHGFAPATVSRTTFPITSGTRTVMIWLRTKKKGRKRVRAKSASAVIVEVVHTHVQKIASTVTRFAESVTVSSHGKGALVHRYVFCLWCV